MMTKNNLEQLQTILGLRFKDTQKLAQSLIHRSYLNENKDKDKNLESNERFEFLGDAILELWISDAIFRKFPKFDEGNLTNLRSLVVCTQSLADVAQKINLGQYIMLSKGEEIHGGRENQSILADTFEAVIGSIYLDQGLEAASEFLTRMLDHIIKSVSAKKVYKDPKSIFQELAQSQRGITPHYETVKETGPDHQKTFEVAVYLDNEMLATGTGSSKQKAEEDASIKATKILSNLV